METAIRSDMLPETVTIALKTASFTTTTNQTPYDTNATDYISRNQNAKERRVQTMFDIQEIGNVEATGSLWGSVISCAGTWGGVYLLYLAACC